MDVIPKTDTEASAGPLKTFTDVLYLTDEGQISPPIKRFLKQKKLSYIVFQIQKFHQLSHRLDLIGTVIVDTVDNEVSKSQKLARIIESLEQKNVGVILLDGLPKQPIKSFSMSTGALDPSFLDDLWFRISVNLAYRKKSPGIITKSATPPVSSLTARGNRLSDQLSSMEALAGNLSEQLRLAGLVQRDFLPTQLPNTDNIRWATSFLPAEWVSGDIYDVVRLDEKHIGFYVADAVGHSMPAALLTIFLKQVLVMGRQVGNKYRIFTPAEVIKNLNLRMTGQKLSGYQFATCCYCLLNTETLEMIYARAGHPYPILLRPGERPQQLQIRGSLLGVFEQALYMQQTVQLKRGDKIILYSDGVEQFVGSFDDEKGFIFDEKFCEIKDLPITEMFDRFNALIQEQPVASAEVDDITMVGFEIS